MASSVRPLKLSFDSSIRPTERENADWEMISSVKALNASYTSMLEALLRRRIFLSMITYLSWIRGSSLKMPVREEHRAKQPAPFAVERRVILAENGFEASESIVEWLVFEVLGVLAVDGLVEVDIVKMELIGSDPKSMGICQRVSGFWVAEEGAHDTHCILYAASRILSRDTGPSL